MTLKEAKKILKKEGFILSLASKVINQTGAIREFANPEVCEAIKVANANKLIIGLSPIEWNEREKRLKKEHEKNNKESAHDKKSMTLEEAKDMLMKEGFKLEGPGKPCDVSECFIELESPEICEAMQIVCSAGYMIMMEVCDFNARKARLKEQLEEHANAPVSGKEQPEEKKGIIYPSTSPKADFYYKHVLNEGNPALKEAASQFNDALLDEQGKKIKHLTKKISRFNKIIHKKNEELRLTKIREKNLAELGLKYVGENEKLKKKLADKIVDEIDARALKSAESALAYKEKVIAEKDEVIADLGKELKAKKALVDHISKIRDSAKINLKLREKECEKLKEALEEKTKLVEMVRKGSKEYREYGIAAEKMIQKMAKVIVNKGPVSSKDFKQYRRLANGYRFYPQLPEFSEEEEKKLSLFRDDSVGAVTNQKDCSPVKDTHPTEDKPEEVELDEILECVRKALEDGHTVSIDYDKAEEGGDQSVTIVQCGNGITLSKEEAEIIERCTKNSTELHYSEKDGLTYTNVFGEEMPIRCLRGMFHVFTDEEIENMKK